MASFVSIRCEFNAVFDITYNTGPYSRNVERENNLGAVVISGSPFEVARLVFH